MTFTYDVTALASSSLMRARLEIGDTDSDVQLLQDEEILQIASVENTFWGTCARCCEVISRGFLAQADIRLGRALYQINSKKAAQYEAMAKFLRTKSLGTVVPWVGGMKVSDKSLYQQDDSIVQPAFTRSMMADPYVGEESSDTGDSQASGLPLGNQ